MIKILKYLAMSSIAFTAQSNFAGQAQPDSPKPNPVLVTAVVYAAGPSWQKELPPQQQNLAPHFEWVKRNFDQGVLVANGPTTDDGKGFYLVRGGVAEAMRFVAQDPAIESSVLQLDSASPWTLFFENLGSGVDDHRALFIANYRPGPQWERGKPMLEQNVASHLAYITERFKRGEVLAGGPVHEHQGRYIIAVDSEARAKAFVADDPSVQSGLFSVELKPWAAINRQSAARPQPAK